MDNKIPGAGQATGAHPGVPPSVAFACVCPKCRAPRAQRRNRAALHRLLEHGHPIEAYCEMCNHSWPVTHGERAELIRIVASW